MVDTLCESAFHIFNPRGAKTMFLTAEAVNELDSRLFRFAILGCDDLPAEDITFADACEGYQFSADLLSWCREAVIGDASAFKADGVSVVRIG